jgi:hypothetical protein
LYLEQMAEVVVVVVEPQALEILQQVADLVLGLVVLVVVAAQALLLELLELVMVQVVAVVQVALEIK